MADDIITIEKASGKISKLSQDQVILITKDLKQDMFSAQRENFKREKKLFILLPCMKLMLSIQEHKDSWHFLQKTLEKLNQK